MDRSDRLKLWRSPKRIVKAKLRDDRRARAYASVSFKRSRKPMVRLTKFSSTLRPWKPTARRRVEGGENNQAIDGSRGGRSTKIHALTNVQCRPLVFMLTGGKSPTAQQALCCLNSFQTATSCTPTRATTSTPSAARSRSKGATPNIPPKANRNWKNCFSPFLNRNPNAIERMFCRIKDFRRIATRYDRSAANFLAAVCIAAAICYWLW
jgi:transposase